MRKKFTIIGAVQGCEDTETRGQAWRVKMSGPTAFHELPDDFASNLKEAWEIVAVVRGWHATPYLAPH